MIPTDQILPLPIGKESTLIVFGTFETLVPWRTLLIEHLHKLHKHLHHTPGFQEAKILLNQHDPGIVVIQSWHASDAYEQAYHLPSIEQHIHGCQHWSLSIIWKSYQAHQAPSQKEG